jgi:hypothetical protein
MHTDVVRLLVNAKADIHTDNDFALRLTCYRGEVGVVQLLLEAKANVYALEEQLLASWK